MGPYPPINRNALKESDPNRPRHVRIRFCGLNPKFHAFGNINPIRPLVPPALQHRKLIIPNLHNRLPQEPLTKNPHAIPLPNLPNLLDILPRVQHHRPQAKIPAKTQPLKEPTKRPLLRYASGHCQVEQKTVLHQSGL